MKKPTHALRRLPLQAQRILVTVSRELPVYVGLHVEGPLKRQAS